ncbi:MAG: hypothetical protein ABIR18_15975 [Chitinophagaceae bacterium]
MDEHIKKVVEKIVHIPHDFHLRKNVSEIALVQESGYIELYNEVTEYEIIETLKKYPHLIAEWLQWSDDCRSSFKWYFKRDDDGKCFVGHFPRDQEFEEINTPDEFKACSAFIKREIEGTRILITNKADH